MQANARLSGRYAGAKTYPLLVLAALLVAGCVNVHVHFPSAPDSPAEQKNEQQKKA